MKVKIKRTFRDKYTRQTYKAGTEVDFTEERIEEILKVGKYVEVIETKKPAKKKVEKKADK